MCQHKRPRIRLKAFESDEFEAGTCWLACMRRQRKRFWRFPVADQRLGGQGYGGAEQRRAAAAGMFGMVSVMPVVSMMPMVAMMTVMTMVAVMSVKCHAALPHRLTRSNLMSPVPCKPLNASGHLINDLFTQWDLFGARLWDLS